MTHDTERLVEHVLERARRYPQDATVDLVRPACVVLEVADRRLDLIECLMEGLAILPRQEPCERLAVLLDALGPRPEQPAALEGVHVSPGRRPAGGMGRLDGAVDVLGSPTGCFADDLPGRRIEHREGLATARAPRSPIDPHPRAVCVSSDHRGASRDLRRAPAVEAGQERALVGEHPVEERPGPRVRPHEGIGHERLQRHPHVAAERRLDRQLLVRLHGLDESAYGQGQVAHRQGLGASRPHPRRDLGACVGGQVRDGATVAHIDDDDHAAVVDDRIDGLKDVDVVTRAALAGKDVADLVVVAHGGHEVGQALLRARVAVCLGLGGRPVGRKHRLGEVEEARVPRAGGGATRGSPRGP